MSLPFFDRLAAAVDRTAVVRPRLASRFETAVPPRLEEDVAPETELQEGDEPFNHAPLVPSPRPSTIVPVPPRGGQLDEGDDVGEERVTRASDVLSQPPAREIADGERRPSEPAPRPAVAEVRPATAEQAVTPPAVDPQPATPRPSSIQPLIESRQPQGAIRPAVEMSPLPPAAVGAEPEDGAAERAIRPADHPSASDVARPSAAEGPPAAESTPVQSVIRPRELPSPELRPSDTAPSRSAADPAPHIEISIGRIELRPAPSPQPPAAAPRPRFQPTVSLDDYLANRQRGER